MVIHQGNLTERRKIEHFRRKCIGKLVPRDRLFFFGNWGNVLRKQVGYDKMTLLVRF